MAHKAMRTWVLVGLAAAMLLWLLPSVAMADNGPHVGDFGKTTDACAGCHRAHRGQAKKLLKDASQQALCLSCHGSNAAGAYTNVTDGVYDAGGTEGTPGAGLRGGGFAYAVMDPDMDGNITSAPVTSKHNVGDAGLTIWGLGSGGVGHTTSSSRATLECGTCHNPHGFSGADYYRILRTDLPCLGCHQIHGSSSPMRSATPPDDATHSLAAQASTGIPDETPKNYTITYNAAGYRDVSYLDQAISEWCSTCHTRYMASDSGDTGDSIFRYRHVTSDNERKCLACHVVHGTSATMGTYSGSVEWPDGTPGGGSADSRLLHVNNRGVCYQCHPAPGSD
ncbi:MAG: cytochrome c3 family protein [Chloroflexi bacterium]|nr:cytochrome c3 family protein [Chloroflexota bacterium]